MHRIRVIVLILLILSAVIFVGYRVYESVNVDDTVPVLNIPEGELTVSVKDGEEMLLNGVTARDEKDGDLTDRVMIDSMSELLEGNRREVTYAVADADNHVVKATRYIQYSDYETPVFSLEQPLQFTVNSKVDVCQYVEVTDCLEGDISNRVKQTYPQMFGEMTGDFPVELQVSNEAGDTVSLPVTVSFYNSGVLTSGRRPQITLKQYIAYIDKGDQFSAASFLEKVTVNGIEYKVSDSLDADEDAITTFTEHDISLKRFHIQNPVDTEIPGCYEVLFELELPDKEATEVRLIVVVRE